MAPAMFLWQTLAAMLVTSAPFAMAFTCEGGSLCAAPSPLTRATTFVQVTSELAKSKEQLLQSRATQVKGLAGEQQGALVTARLAHQFLQTPANIAEALRKGLEGIQFAIRPLQAQPSDVVGGISKLGSTLLDCMVLIITEEGKSNWGDYDKFQKEWTEKFNGLAASVDDIKLDLNEFVATGKVKHLTSGLSQILSQASDISLDLVPGDLGKTISRYLDSLNKAFVSVGEAIRQFEDGDTLSSLETVYFGLRNATDSLMPELVENNAMYNSIVNTLDGIVGGISKDVLEYKRRIAESSACWKVSRSRERRMPKICPDGFNWDGERHCWPKEDSKCWQPAAECVPTFIFRGDTYSNCTRKNHKQPWCSHNAKYKWGKWSNCEEVACSESLLSLSAGSVDRSTSGKQQKGTIPARCDDSDDSKYSEKTGGWCYADCSTGFEAFGAKCWTQCEGSTFPAESSLICGRDPGVLASTLMELLTVTLHSAFRAVTVISKMQAVGVDAENLGSTIQILIDAGKPFALPRCPSINA